MFYAKIEKRLLKRFESFIALSQLAEFSKKQDVFRPYCSALFGGSQNSHWRRTTSPEDGSRPRPGCSLERGDFNLTLETILHVEDSDDAAPPSGADSSSRQRPHSSPKIRPTPPHRRPRASSRSNQTKPPYHRPNLASQSPIPAHKNYLGSRFRVLPGGPSQDGAAIMNKVGLLISSYYRAPTSRRPAMQVRYGLLFSPGQFCLFERIFITDKDNSRRPTLLISPFYDTARNRKRQARANAEVGALIALRFALTIPDDDVRHGDGSVTRGVPHDVDLDLAVLAEEATADRMRNEIAQQTSARDVHLQDTPQLQAASLNHLAEDLGRQAPATLTSHSRHERFERCKFSAYADDTDDDPFGPCPAEVLVTGDLALAGVTYDYNAYPSSDVEDLVTDLAAYKALASAGAAIAQLWGAYDDARGNWAGLLMEDLGDARCPPPPPLAHSRSQTVARSTNAVGRLHKAGVVPGDFARRRDGAWCLVDFAQDRIDHVCPSELYELVLVRKALAL
ncbi:hypothetical protein DFH09DRAFT_1416540 [Mycena vulgaris]|nr:hypothetical protein DFH09DRAFT_1416540 [Mycena vulgaris]